MKKKLLLVFIAFVFNFGSTLVLPIRVLAWNCDPATVCENRDIDGATMCQKKDASGRTYNTNCCPIGYSIVNSRCVQNNVDPDADSTPSAVIGRIDAPPGVYNYSLRGIGNIGLVFFISNIIKLATVIAGLWSLINFILAGYLYITAQGANANEKVQAKITQSVIGLILIVGAYTIIAIISLVFFGDAGYVLNPSIPGPN